MAREHGNLDLNRKIKSALGTMLFEPLGVRADQTKMNEAIQAVIYNSKPFHGKSGSDLPLEKGEFFLNLTSASVSMVIPGLTEPTEVGRLNLAPGALVGYEGALAEIDHRTAGLRAEGNVDLLRVKVDFLAQLSDDPDKRAALLHAATARVAGMFAGFNSPLPVSSPFTSVEKYLTPVSPQEFYNCQSPLAVQGGYSIHFGKGGTVVDICAPEAHMVHVFAESGFHKKGGDRTSNVLLIPSSDASVHAFKSTFAQDPDLAQVLLRASLDRLRQMNIAKALDEAQRMASEVSAGPDIPKSDVSMLERVFGFFISST